MEEIKDAMKRKKTLEAIPLDKLGDERR